MTHSNTHTEEDDTMKRVMIKAVKGEGSQHEVILSCQQKHLMVLRRMTKGAAAPSETQACITETRDKMIRLGIIDHNNQLTRLYKGS